MMTAALMQTGSSSVFAAFQTAGIVGFEKDDLHQEERLVALRATDTLKYINLYNMNPLNRCNSNMSSTAAGFPCNINPPYQQHAYSTRIMDPTQGGSPQSRFDDVFEAPGVLERIDGVSERVMTVEGLGTLLNTARHTGDLGGENSLNSTFGLSGSNMAYFHPSVTDPSGYMPLAQWQAQLAWTGFWVAFKRDSPS